MNSYVWAVLLNLGVLLLAMLGTMLLLRRMYKDDAVIIDVKLAEDADCQKGECG